MGKFQAEKLDAKELLLIYREMERSEWSIKL